MLMRAVRAMRAGNQTWRDLRKILKKTERELEDKLLEIGGARTIESARAERLLREVRKILDGGALLFFTRLESAGLQFANLEARGSINSLTRYIPVEREYVAPSTRLLEAVAKEQPFSGAILKDHVSKWAADTVFKAQAQIRTAIIQGETIPQIVERVKAVLGTSTENARALTQTYVMHVTNAARKETYAANKDVIEGELWRATLDDRTCVACGSLDGQKYKVGKGPQPPLHFNCRCVRVPIVKGREKLIKDGVIPKGQRASKDGPVDEALTFEQWLKRQSTTRQVAVLGPKRHALWKKGVKLGKFVNDQNQVMTLSELEKTI